jgi:hypothetical protein
VRARARACVCYGGGGSVWLGQVAVKVHGGGVLISATISLHQNVQADSGARPAFCSVGNADSSLLSSARFKNEWRYTSTCLTRIHGVCRDSLTMY